MPDASDTPGVAHRLLSGANDGARPSGRGDEPSREPNRSTLSVSKSCFLSTFPGPVREWLLDNGEIINAFAQPERERGGASGPDKHTLPSRA